MTNPVIVRELPWVVLLPHSDTLHTSLSHGAAINTFQGLLLDDEFSEIETIHDSNFDVYIRACFVVVVSE